MAIEVRVPLLLHKLWNLYEYEGIRSSSSKETVKSAIEQLELIASWIRDANEETIRSDLEAFWRISLSMEDRIDTFIVTTEQRRQGILNQMISPFIFFESKDEKLLREEMAEVIDLARRLNQQAPQPLADGTGSHPQLPQLRSLDNMALDDSDFIRFNDEETKLKDQLFGQQRRKSETVIAVTGKAGSGKTFDKNNL